MKYELRKEEKKKTEEELAVVMSHNASTSTPSDPFGGLSPSTHLPHSFFGENLEGSFSTAREICSLAPNYFVPQNVLGAQPSLEVIGWNKEKHQEARMTTTNIWFYNNLPFNVVNNPFVKVW